MSEDDDTRGSDADVGGSADESDDEGWRFALDEVGAEAGPPPLEPGAPTVENALFVLVGVALTVVLVVGAV